MAVVCRDVRSLSEKQTAFTAVMAEAARVLQAGGLVAFPTETVYGLGASIRRPDALKRIFKVKGRPTDNPLIVHVASAEAAARLSEVWPPAADAATRAFWPGPLTLVVRRRAGIPDIITAGRETVAVRAPAHRVARALIKLAGPLAAPSANSSGRPSPTRAEHVLEDLGDRVDMIIDDGPCAVGLESTVLDVVDHPPTVLRPGGIAVESLREVLGTVVTLSGSNDLLAARSPGTRYRHYAPTTPLIVVQVQSGWPLTKVMDLVGQEVDRQRSGGRQVGLLAADEICAAVKADVSAGLGPYREPVSSARMLFDALRRLDRHRPDVIVTHTYPAIGLGAAVNNRLLRAADEVRSAGNSTVGNTALKQKEGPPLLPQRILFICTGNTCRSPMAAAVLRELAAAAGINLEVRSAGTAALPGDTVNRMVVSLLAERGIDVANQPARLMTEADAEWADLILTMTRAQRDHLQAQFPHLAERVYTLAAYAGAAEQDIADPFGGDEQVYRTTLAQLDRYLGAIVQRWVEGAK